MRFLRLALDRLASEVVADRGVLEVAEIVGGVDVRLPGSLIKRGNEVAAVDGDTVDGGEELVRLHGVRRRGRRRTPQDQEPEQGYGVTQPRGQPASAFE